MYRLIKKSNNLRRCLILKLSLIFILSWYAISIYYHTFIKQYKVPEELIIRKSNLSKKRVTVVIHGEAFAHWGRKKGSHTRIWNQLIPHLGEKIHNLKNSRNNENILLFVLPHTWIKAVAPAWFFPLVSLMAADKATLESAEEPTLGPKSYILHQNPWESIEDSLNNAGIRESRNHQIIYISTFPTSLSAQNTVWCRVSFIYDLIQQNYGEDMKSSEFLRSKEREIEKGNIFIVPSNSTRKDLLRHYNHISTKQVATIPLRISETFRPASSALMEKFRSTYSITKPYFLFVGYRKAYKNTQKVWSAIHSLYKKHFFKDNQYQFVMVGAKFDSEERTWAKDVTNQVIVIESLDDELLTAAYTGSIALLYCSGMEGYGLPILEAMACGTAVITSNISSMPEVAGPAGFYVDPKNEQTIAQQIVLVITNSTMRKERIKIGFQVASKLGYTTENQTHSTTGWSVYAEKVLHHIGKKWWAKEENEKVRKHRNENVCNIRQCYGTQWLLDENQIYESDGFL